MSEPEIAVKMWKNSIDIAGVLHSLGPTIASNPADFIAGLICSLCVTSIETKAPGASSESVRANLHTLLDAYYTVVEKEHLKGK